MTSGSKPSSSPPKVLADSLFLRWLADEGISLAFTTYQTNWLGFLGLDPQGSLSAHQRQFPRPMGLFVQAETLYVACKYQLWQLTNVLQPGQFFQGYDKLYIPRVAYTTGDLDTHDIVVDHQGRLIMVSTVLNCLTTVSDRNSCQPLWHPPFISSVINEDRCHLSGLALVEGQPRYVTCVSQTDVVNGWRSQRRSGGCMVEVPSGDIVVQGLSMPHSPRYYQDQLWVLNSGTGELGYIDLATHSFQGVVFCPGYCRGLAFWNHYAIVGLSKPRDDTFAGLVLGETLAAKRIEPQCGILVIDLKTSQILHGVRIEGVITELYDVAVLPGVKRPMALGFQTDEIAQILTLDPMGSLLS